MVICIPLRQKIRPHTHLRLQIIDHIGYKNLCKLKGQGVTYRSLLLMKTSSNKLSPDYHMAAL